MKTRLRQHNELKLFITIGACLIGVSIINYACQNNRTNKTMSEKISGQQPLDTDRLLTVANLEQTDSGRTAIVWFFETPQIFEFNLDGEQAQQIFKLIKDAKEKQLPVNIHSTTIRGKNVIDKAIPATSAQIDSYNKEKAQRQKPIRVPPPPNN